MSELDPNSDICQIQTKNLNLANLGRMVVFRCPPYIQNQPGVDLAAADLVDDARLGGMALKSFLLYEHPEQSSA